MKIEFARGIEKIVGIVGIVRCVKIVRSV